MKEELKQLGQAVRAHREHGGGLRLPKSLRTEVAEAAQRARDGGVSLGMIATMTGLSAQSIQRWTQSRRGTALVPVRVRGTTPSDVTVVSPEGWRVLGLDLQGAASLLRAVR